MKLLVKYFEIYYLRGMKLLITGSRNYVDYKGLSEAIDAILIGMSCHYGVHEHIEEILHGGAKGADELAGIYANMHGIKCTVIRPDYAKHAPRIAPLLRNSELVKKADATLALYGTGRNEKGGTADTARKTKAANNYLLECYDDGTHKHTPPKPTQAKLW